MKTEIAFYLKLTGASPGLCLVDGRGKPARPDYRSFTGSARRALMEFDTLLKRQSRFLPWDTDGQAFGQDAALHDPGDRMIDIAARSGLLRNPEGLPVTLVRGEGRLLLSIIPGKGDVLEVRPLLETRGLEAEPGELSPDSDLRAVSPRFLLVKNLLVPCEDLGAHWSEAETLAGKVKRDELPLFLSMVLSRFPGLGIRCEGYRVLEGPPKTTVPGLLFQEIDAYGYLHVKPVSSIPGYPPGFFDDQDIIKIVEMDEQEKELSLAEVVFPFSPLEEFRNIIKKSGKARRDQVMEEEGRFIFSPEYAQRFLEKSMDDLVSSFTLYQAETLARYKIRYSAPAIRLKLDHGIDFLEGSASVTIDETTWPWRSFLAEYRKNGSLVMPDNTRVFPAPEVMRRLEGLLRRVKGAAGDDEERVEISFFDLMMFDLGKEVAAAPEVKRRIESFYLGFNQIHTRDGDFSLAESSLRPYQMYGVQWMEHLGDHGVGGCLADEMGLGKTVQVISLLRRAYQAGLSGPSLIIAPKSLVWNWASELKRFAPELPVHIHYGTGRDSGEISSGKNTIILTTYTTTRMDIEDLTSVEFAYLVLDESQHIKNLNAKRTLAILGLTARRRLALSGTPVENSLSELYSLFRFLNPSFFGSKGHFSREYGKPIQEDHDTAVLKDLKRKIYPFMLRRLKQEVLTDLPEKSEQTLMVELDREHLAVYHRRRAYHAERIRRAIEEKGIIKASFFILQALGELRRLAGIPEDDGEYPEPSAKREQLIEMVKDIRENGHKCLIFTNFLAAVEMISGDLAAAGIGNLVMTGATGNRRELVQQFQTDPDIGAFVMTLKTGGVGLNLTAADYVFIFDPWWNRSAESQGIDRTHRIGQRNPVFCYRIIARDTIEEKMLLLQQQKAELTSSLLSSDTEAMKALSEEDVRFLLEG